MNGERRVPSEVKVSAYLLFYVQVALSRRVTTLSKGANSSEGSLIAKREKPNIEREKDAFFLDEKNIRNNKLNWDDAHDSTQVRNQKTPDRS